MVGAGIVGAAIARQLARRGARVVVLDGSEPGAGVTARAFGWIHASGAAAPPGLRRRALAP